MVKGIITQGTALLSCVIWHTGHKEIAFRREWFELPSANAPQIYLRHADWGGNPASVQLVLVLHVFNPGKKRITEMPHTRMAYLDESERREQPYELKLKEL